MPKRSVFVATENRKAIEFLTAYFADTQSIPAVARSKADLALLFSTAPYFVFLQTDWVDSQVAGQLCELKSKAPKMKYFGLGRVTDELVSWNGSFELPLEEKSFRKVVLSEVDLPECIKLVVVDDEPEVGEMVQDYFDVRTNPAFQIRTALNGLEGFKLVEQDPPHCLILDLKMPVRSGADLYQDLIRSGRKIPTIIFIDSTAADAIVEIRKWGTPVFVEKGGHYSSMPDMLALVKKLVAFS